MTVSPINRYKQNGNAQKILGAVYTPPRVASALVRWAVRSRHDRVLDPSCGEGVFLSAARTHLADLGNNHPLCVGVDVDPGTAFAAGAICKDFFDWARSAPKFDAIVGNPPFIRSHLFSEHSRDLAFRQMKEMGITPSRLMSTWAPFLALSCKLLTDDGRLAMVIPEELLHVGYADELRNFLLNRFRRVIVCFSNGDLFPSVQQAVVLLICDNDAAGPSGLLTMTFGQLEEGQPYSVDAAPAWEWSSKWTHLFLSKYERVAVTESLEQLDWKPLKEYGRVEVGVVTGYNDFFIIDEERQQSLELKSSLTPIITNARNLKGLKFTADDFREIVRAGRPAFLIHTSEPTAKLPIKLRKYLEEGARRGADQRFKCRVREPWYAVPSVWSADALLLRQAGEVPRLVHLTGDYTSTDTIHRVRWKQPSQGKRIVVSFLNTWTLIACELIGRSYGGGVLELMPGEANTIPIPPPVAQLDMIFDPVDKLLRQRNFNVAIEMVDSIVTPRSIEHSQYDNARNTLSKLISRRKNKQNGNH